MAKKATNLIAAILLLSAALMACAECEEMGAFLLVKGIALVAGYAGVKLYKHSCEEGGLV